MHSLDFVAFVAYTYIYIVPVSGNYARFNKTTRKMAVRLCLVNCVTFQ